MKYLNCIDREDIKNAIQMIMTNNIKGQGVKWYLEYGGSKFSCSLVIQKAILIKCGVDVKISNFQSELIRGFLNRRQFIVKPY